MDKKPLNDPGSPGQPRLVLRVLKITLWIGTSFFTLAAVALTSLYLYLTSDVPTAAEIRKGGLAINGAKYEGHNHPLPLAEIPPMVQKAFVAVEDADFYDREYGQSLWEFMRQTYICATGRTMCCGSTIVQQVARLKQPDSWRGRDWLIKLPILTKRLEAGLTNDEILEIYLNQVYLGRGAFGVEAAAQTYYGTPIARVSLAEAAQLASLVRAPGTLNAYPERMKERRLYTVDRMLYLGFITEEQARAAKVEEIIIKTVSK